MCQELNFDISITVLYTPTPSSVQAQKKDGLELGHCKAFMSVHEGILLDGLPQHQYVFQLAAGKHPYQVHPEKDRVFPKNLAKRVPFCFQCLVFCVR